MKKIFLLLSLVVMSIVTKAHTPTQQCSASGWYTYIWAYLGNATSVEITWGHGQHSVNHGNGYDTVIKNLNLRPITTFQAPAGQDVTFEFNDGYETHFAVHVSSCGNLPVLMSTFNTRRIGDGIYTVSWMTEIESNNDYFTVQAATDTGSWKTVAIVKSYYPDGNGSTPHNYNVLVNAGSSNITESGFGTNLFIVYIVLFVFFLIVGRIRNRYWFSIIMIVSLFSCSKTNIVTPPVKTYTYFRIIQTDKDGTFVNSPVMVVKN